MMCNCYWIVLYTVHVQAFCLGGRFFRTWCIMITVRKPTCFAHSGCFAVMMAERLQPNGTSSLLSTLSPADIGLQAATANGDDSSDGDEKMTRSKRRKKTRVSR